MSKIKKREFNKLRIYKKISRENTGPHGRGGVHRTERDRPRQNPSLYDYLNEVDSELNEEVKDETITQIPNH